MGHVLTLTTARRAAALLAAVGAVLGLAGGCTADQVSRLPRAPRDGSFQRGVALGLYSENREHDYGNELDEIRGHGASHVSLIFSWYQEDPEATFIAPSDVTTPTDLRVRRVIRAARERGLQVMLFPILGLLRRGPADWRGNIRPRDLAAWWQSYEVFIERYARLCAQESCGALSVGSELVSLEKHSPEWHALIARMRNLFRGQLLYSANFDHYREVPFWRALDALGISAYFRLTARPAEPATGGRAAPPPERPTVAELMSAWAPIRRELDDFARRTGRPLVFTELGYGSQRGASATPWDDAPTRPADLEEQRRLYEAFVRSWGGDPLLSGSYFWVWYNPGGILDRSYSVRRKPAELILRQFYRDFSQYPAGAATR